MSLSTRILIIASVLLFFVFTPSSIFAQTAPYQPSINDAQQQSNKIQTVLAGFSQIVICQLTNRDVLHPGFDCAGSKIGTTSKAQSNGILGMVTGGISTMYRPPINTAQSIQYFAGNFGLLKPVLAQNDPSTDNNGAFQTFSFIQPMYLNIRNISYMLLVLVFIFIGIAIMLRFKIDPRTAMSIQNQLPKIVIGIVLITFSYAIAGLLVDGMWLLTYFGVNTIGSVAQLECGVGNGTDNTTFAGVASKGLLNNPIAFTSSVFSDAGCFGSFSGIGGLSKDVGASMGSALSGAILEAIGLNTPSAQACDLGFLGIGSDGSLGECIQKGIYSFLTFLISVVAIIIVLVAIIMALFRLWITLIKAYVYILLDVITAPIQILMGIMPGGKMGFGRWLRHITAYLLLFPASATMIILAVSFALNKSLNEPSSSTTFYPPLIGIPGLSGNLGALIAFGLIMITPELLEMIKEALQVKNSPKASTAIVGGFTRGIAPTQALGGLGSGLFGKNKDNSPKIGNIGMGWLGQKVGVSGRGAEERFLSKKLGINTIRRTREGFEKRRDDAILNSRQHKRSSIENAANYAYNETFRQTHDHVQAQKASADAREKMLQSFKPTAVPTPPAQPSNASTSSASPATTPHLTTAGAISAATTPHTTNTPPATPTGPSTAGHTSAPVSPSSTPPIPTVSTPIVTPLMQASWVGGTNLIHNGTTILTRTSPTSSVYLLPGSRSPMSESLTDWLARKGYEIV